VLGLDLAGGLSGAALAPVDWGGDWGKVATRTVGYQLPKIGSRARAACDASRAQWEATRGIAIASTIGTMCARVVPMRHSRVHVYAETMFVGANQSAVIPLAYVRGAVLTALAGMGATVHDVSASEWRKLLLGTPNGLRADVKAATFRTIVASGAPPTWCEDEYDAAAIMNWGMHQHGGLFFSCPAPDAKPDKGGE
jgi:Holliday junction resolvasome RuvABC endonuclease subunit